MKYFVFVGLRTLKFVLFLSFFTSNLYSYNQADLSRFLSGEKEMSFADLSNICIENFDASYINLEGATLKNSKFYNVNFCGAKFNNIDKGKRGGRCPADLRKVAMENVDLSCTYLRRVKMGGSFLKRVNLSGADCRNLKAVKAILIEIIYDDCDLRNANFNHSDYDLEEICRAGQIGGLKLQSLIGEDASIQVGSDNIIARRYSNCEAIMPEKIINYDKCYICLEEYNASQDIALFYCGHTFCASCANKSLSMHYVDKVGLKHECPVCRRYVDQYKKVTLEELMAID